MGKANPDDPLVYPLGSDDVTARFPPTLLISGTRSFEFSAALDSHDALTRAGVETSLPRLGRYVPWFHLGPSYPSRARPTPSSRISFERIWGTDR